MNGTATGLLDAEHEYEKLKGLIYRLTHNFHRKYGGNFDGGSFDELLSEAHFAFVRAVQNYDPNRGAKLITYVWHAVENGLKRTLIRPTNYLREGPHVKRREVPLQGLRISRRRSLGEKLGRLSEEAASVLRIALFIRGSSPATKRRHLIEVLCEYGWAAEEIINCFEEIQEVL